MKQVYFARAEDLNVVKIGRSKNVPQRLLLLGSACPATLSLVATRGETKVFSESAVHRVCASRRKKGEWFRVTDDEVNLITSQRSIERIATLHELPPWQFAQLLRDNDDAETTDVYLRLLALHDQEFEDCIQRAKNSETRIRIPRTGRHNVHIHVRIDESLSKLIRDAAGSAGINASAWVRQRLEESAKRELGK